MVSKIWDSVINKEIWLHNIAIYIWGENITTETH